jgi:translation elongation factor EF-Ts
MQVRKFVRFALGEGVDKQQTAESAAA